MKLLPNPAHTGSGSTSENPSFWTSWFQQLWLAVTQGLSVAASSQSAGFASMVGGTVTVTSKAVPAANVPILLSYFGSPTTPGQLYISALVPGTSFTISSTAATTATVSWAIVNLL